jgi:hypothetical protein
MSHADRNQGNERKWSKNEWHGYAPVAEAGHPEARCDQVESRNASPRQIRSPVSLIVNFVGHYTRSAKVAASSYLRNVRFPPKLAVRLRPIADIRDQGQVQIEGSVE